MPSLVLCYADEDRTAAHQLARFLEANLPYDVALDECRIRPDFDLIDAADRALSADAALVLLSPASVPKTWKRERWEPVLFAKPGEIATPLGVALLAECRFPELLRRRIFFDLSRDFRQGSREIRHWLLRGEGTASAERTASAEVFPELRATIGDWPGVALDVAPEAARAFATACAGDFESVHRILCNGRSAAGILGDIGTSLGLRLAGTIDQNRASVVDDCAAHRRLFVFESISPSHLDLVRFGGKASVITSHNPETPERVSFQQMQEEIGTAFLIAARDREQCLALAGPATLLTYQLLESNFEAGLRLGWALLAILKSAARFAESIEILAAMETAARARHDEMALFKIEWEQSWISEDSGDWGVRILPTAGDDVAQLNLFEQLV